MNKEEFNTIKVGDKIKFKLTSFMYQPPTETGKVLRVMKDSCTVYRNGCPDFFIKRNQIIGVEK